MVKGRNRVTPILVIIVIVLAWIFIGILLYKFNKMGIIGGVKRLKIDDDLVEELYSYTTDSDIILYSQKNYSLDSLPSDYIFSKATRFMTLEDMEIGKGQFRITYESLDSAIKTAFGPDIKYDLTKINSSIVTDFESNDHKLVFNVKYDANSKMYVGTYSLSNAVNNVQVGKKLLSATKTKTVNLKIGYVFYKHDTNYKICDNYKCEKIVSEIDNIEDYDYDDGDKITVSLRKASDEVYYYDSNE